MISIGYDYNLIIIFVLISCIALVTVFFIRKWEIKSYLEKKNLVEQELKLNESIIENTKEPFIIFTTNLNAKFIKVNKATTQLTGYSREEILNKAPANIDIGLDEQIWNKIKKNIHKKQYVEFEGIILKKDNTKIFVEVIVQELKSNNKSYLIANLKDITKRKEIQDNILSSTKQYQEGLVFGNIAVWTYNIEEHKFKFTKQAHFLFDKHQNNYHIAFNDFLHMILDKQDDFKTLFQDALKNKTSFNTELHIKQFTEQNIWVYVSGGFVVENDKTKFLGIIQDITTNKQIQLQYEQKRLELEKFNKVLVGRELEMINLKQQINQLSIKLNGTIIYPEFWNNEQVEVK